MKMIKNTVQLYLSHPVFNDIIKKVSISFILKVVGTLSAFLLYFVISRTYGAEGMGIFSLFVALMGLLGMLSTIGMSSSIIRFVPYLLSHKQFSYLSKLGKIHFSLSGSLALLLSIFLFTFATKLSEYIFQHQENIWLIQIVAIVLPFYSLFLIGNEFLRNLGYIGLFEYFRSIHMQGITLIGLIFLYPLYKFNQLPIVIAASLYILAFFIIWKIITQHIKQYKKNINSDELDSAPIDKSHQVSYSNVLRISSPMLLTAFSALVMERLDTLMIGYFYGNEEVGLYNIALKLSTLILFLIIPLNAVLVPKISKHFWKNELDDVNMLVSKISKLMFLIGISLLFILVIFSEFFLGLFGVEFIQAKTAMLFLIVGYFFNAIHGLADQVLNLSGNEKKLSLIFSFGLLINIILNLLLIPAYGINGAAFATMSSMIIWNVLAGLAVKKYTGIEVVYVPGLTKN